MAHSVTATSPPHSLLHNNLFGRNSTRLGSTRVQSVSCIALFAVCTPFANSQSGCVETRKEERGGWMRNQFHPSSPPFPFPSSRFLSSPSTPSTHQSVYCEEEGIEDCTCVHNRGDGAGRVSGDLRGGEGGRGCDLVGWEGGRIALQPAFGGSICICVRPSPAPCTRQLLGCVRQRESPRALFHAC